MSILCMPGPSTEAQIPAHATSFHLPAVVIRQAPKIRFPTASTDRALQTFISMERTRIRTQMTANLPTISSHQASIYIALCQTARWRLSGPRSSPRSAHRPLFGCSTSGPVLGGSAAPSWRRGMTMSVSICRSACCASSCDTPVRPRRPAPKLVQADGQRLPFRDASFDAVMMIQVLGAVLRWRPLVSEALRVLRSPGRLVIGHTVTPTDGVDAKMKRRWRRCSPRWARRPITTNARDEVIGLLGSSRRQQPRDRGRVGQPCARRWPFSIANRAGRSLQGCQSGSRMRRWPSCAIGPARRSVSLDVALTEQHAFELGYSSSTTTGIDDMLEKTNSAVLTELGKRLVQWILERRHHTSRDRGDAELRHPALGQRGEDRWPEHHGPRPQRGLAPGRRDRRQPRSSQDDPGHWRRHPRPSRLQPCDRSRTASRRAHRAGHGRRLAECADAAIPAGPTRDRVRRAGRFRVSAALPHGAGRGDLPGHAAVQAMGGQSRASDGFPRSVPIPAAS